MASYPYAPPPPPPPSATSTNTFSSYGHSQPYGHTPPRGAHAAVAHNSRGARGHHQGSGRPDYGSQPYYQQDYSSSSAPAYNAAQPSAYWQGNPHMSHQHQPVAPAPPANFHPNYPAQGFAPQPAQGYQPQYSSQPPRPAYVPTYGQQAHEYPPAQQWPEQGHSHSSYQSRGGRGGYQGDRGGHKSDPSPAPPFRYEQQRSYSHPVHANTSYAPPYPQSTQHQPPAPYQQASYSYPSNPPPSYAASSHSHRGSHHRGRGRGGFAHAERGGRGGSDRGDKFRQRDHRDPRPGNISNHTQKSDQASAKKKKRKTNTLGLTPGDDDSDDNQIDVDEEKHLEELLGADVPSIPDLAAWIAERRANYPTKSRIQAKKAVASVQAPSGNRGDKSKNEIDKEVAEYNRLKKRLEKFERKIEKRKRAANDEGDEMRASPDSSEDDSEDDKPEVLPTGKAPPAFLPPPPIKRADPTNHCKYYSTGGICGKKGKCRFVHDPAIREAALQERTRNGGRMTLKQRLLLNDKDHDDMEVVKTIVEMRANGRLLDPESSDLRGSRQTNDHIGSTTASSLPVAPGTANLPPNPYASSKSAERPN